MLWSWVTAPQSSSPELQLPAQQNKVHNIDKAFPVSDLEFKSETWGVLGTMLHAYACQRLPAGMTITYNIMVITGQPVVTTCIPDRGASTSSLMSLVICVKLLLPYRQTDRQQALLWPLTLDQYTIIQYTMHINYNLAAHAGWSHDYFAILCSSVC